MKYIILILLTAFCFSVKSQSIYTPMTAGGYQMKYLKTDSGFALPFRDTTIGRGVDRPGLMVVNPQDSLPYYYSGKLWKPVYIDSSGVIELINGKIDSITVNGNNIFYWVAGLGYGQQLNKLDSIHVSSDSIFTCIAGNCTFQYLTTAGTGTVTQIIAGFGLLPDTITASGTLAVDTSVFHTSNWNNAAYAAISHTHSASDIISGTLPIVRGGTGLSGIGAVGQELRVASSGTALEYFTPNYASQTYVDSLNSVKSLSGSYYGIISGGVVTYSGTGYTYYVSACKYMIGGVVYNSRDTSITLTAADATDPRIDLFAVDTLNRVVKITGTAAATPLTPQVDPASQIALTTGITLPPASTTPTGTSSTLIYDENTEWTTGGTATVDFNNTAQPYHGTKDAYVSAYSKNSNLTFTNGSNVTVSGQILRLFIRLNNSNYNFHFQFYNGTTAVSNLLTLNGFGFNPTLYGTYQNVSIPLSSFTWSGASFDKLVISMTGKGATGTFYLDYVSLESGTPIITPPTDYSNKLDSVFLSNDSLFQYVKGVKTFRGLFSGSYGSGGISKLGTSPYGLVKPNDSTYYVDSSLLLTKLMAAATYLTPSNANATYLKISDTTNKWIPKGTNFPVYVRKPVVAIDSATIGLDSVYVRDTSLNLKGGTINQVLKKNSGANGDWSWQDESGSTDTTSLSNRINAKQNALPTGTNGQILTLAGGVPAWKDTIPLLDFNFTSIKNNDLLKYDSVNNRWINFTPVPYTPPIDTTALFVFGGGGGNASDTASFTTSTIYGSFFNTGSDTLVLTRMQIGLQGTSPNVTVRIYWNDSLNVTAGATPLTTSGTSATNIYGGTSVTSFVNTKIPPNVWVWCTTSVVTTKPTYMTVTLIGYKNRTL